VTVIAGAEEQKKIATKEDRSSGTVHMIDKDTSTIIIRKGTGRRAVIYTAETKITIQNKPGSQDDVIVGRRRPALVRKREDPGSFSLRPRREPIRLGFEDRWRKFANRDPSS
jgi:hypothetical protein